MRLAHELKQPLHSLLGCPGPVSHRQYVAWRCWFQLEWNRPGRLENYLMMLGCEVRRVLAKEPNSIQPEHLRLKFEFKRPPTAKERAEHKKLEQILVKEKWKALVGNANRLKPPDKK